MRYYESVGYSFERNAGSRTLKIKEQLKLFQSRNVELNAIIKWTTILLLVDNTLQLYLFNQFVPNAPFLCPLKTFENRKFFCFQEHWEQMG